jgi:regulator of sirC expression with transglutaminase-like and TPR domain
MGKNSQAIGQYQRYLEILPNGSEAQVAKAAIERLKE